MRGDLTKDFEGKVKKVMKETLNNYSFEIGITLGPAKVTLRAIPVQNKNEEELSR